MTSTSSTFDPFRAGAYLPVFLRQIEDGREGVFSESEAFAFLRKRRLRVCFIDPLSLPSIYL